MERGGHLASPTSPDTPSSWVEAQQLSGWACLPVLQWHQDKATSMSAEKADHLPDLTLSFEPLQSKDISRSHQPALTQNGCHGQAYTLWREEPRLTSSPDTPFHPGSRCSSSQGGLAFQSCSGIRTRPPLCQQKRQTTYLTSPSASNRYSLRTSAGPISLHSQEMAAIIRQTSDRERGNLASPTSPDTPFHPGSRCSSSQGGLAFQSCSGIRTRPPLCQQKRQTTYLTSPSASNRYSLRTSAGPISLHSQEMAAMVRHTPYGERRSPRLTWRGAAALRVGLPSSPAVASGQGHLYVSRKGRPLT